MKKTYNVGGVILLLLALLAGCTASNEIVVDRQSSEIDSLQAMIAGLDEELSFVRDSLTFLKGIESGQYYRDQRVLQDEIQRLEYVLEVCRDGGRTIQTISVDQIFQPASAILTDDGRAMLDELADTLASRHSGDIIRIEAHSDSSPIGSSLAEKYPSNWELSAARAAAVVRYLVDEHELPTGRLEVASYGDTRPIARNDTAAGRQKNRRLRVAVLTR